MDLLDRFVAEVSNLQHYWMSFVIAIFVVGLAIWKIAYGYFEGRLKTKDATIAHQTTVIDDYRDKLSGATPEQAKERIDALEERLAKIEPRRITIAQKAELTRVLKDFEGQAGEILADSSEPDAMALYNPLYAALHEANWHMSGGFSSNLTDERPSKSGFVIVLDDPSCPTEAEAALLGILASFGLVVETERRSQPNRRIEMIITRREGNL